MLIARYKHVWRVERSLENRSMTTTDIKAVFFDIDGTLTSFVTHKVPNSTVEAIQRLQSAGIKVLICTGRAPSQMKVVLDTMPISFDGIVAFNGQYCFDEQGYLESQALDQSDIRVILDWLDQHPDVCVILVKRITSTSTIPTRHCSRPGAVLAKPPPSNISRILVCGR